MEGREASVWLVVGRRAPVVIHVRVVGVIAKLLLLLGLLGVAVLVHGGHSSVLLRHRKRVDPAAAVTETKVIIGRRINHLPRAYNDSRVGTIHVCRRIGAV